MTWIASPWLQANLEGMRGAARSLGAQRTRCGDVNLALRQPSQPGVVSGDARVHRTLEGEPLPSASLRQLLRGGTRRDARGNPAGMAETR